MQDPYGWFQWYCRFFDGRRTEDDGRQIARWLGLASERGRFRKWLITMVVKKGATWDDEKISPKIRQTLHHWAYTLTEADFNAELRARAAKEKAAPAKKKAKKPQGKAKK